jgi:hypothetical protein
MYCSTCGAQVTPGRGTCQVCGATVARAPQFGQPSQPQFGPQGQPQLGGQQQFGGQPQLGPPQQFGGQYPTNLPAMAVPHGLDAYGEPVAICPRCGFRGQSVGYFSRGLHIAGLVGLTVMTWVGGIVYYLLRREYRVCSRCGENLGERGVRSMALVGPGGVRIPMHDDSPIPSESSGRNGWSIALFIFAAFLLMAGVGSGALPPVMMAAMAAGGGWMLQKGARESREKRRDAIIQSLQLPVLKLAAARGGRLTVTQVSTEMGWPLTRAEKVLNSLEDGFRVMSDVTDDGVIVYDFVELRHEGELNALGTSTQLPPPPPPASRPGNQLQA